MAIIVRLAKNAIKYKVGLHLVNKRKLTTVRD